MKRLLFLLFCVLLVEASLVNHYSEIYIKTKTELKLELQLVDSKTNNSDDDYRDQLNSQIGSLEKECLTLPEYSFIPEVCKRTYRCESAEYRAGCPCWSRELQQERRRDSATSVYTYNEYHPRGATPPSALTQHDAVRQCDEVPPPWGWLYIYSGAGVSGRLAEFAHCVRDGVVDCYCSSTRFLRAMNELPFKPFKGLDIEFCDNKYRQFSCKEGLGCPCWNSNTTYYEINDKEFITEVQLVHCKKVDLPCSDVRVKAGCPCWYIEFYGENAKSIEFRYNFRLNKYDEDKTSLEVKEKEVYYGKVCKHDEYVALNGFGVNVFAHCFRDGHVVCYCGRWPILPLPSTGTSPNDANLIDTCEAHILYY